MQAAPDAAGTSVLTLRAGQDGNWVDATLVVNVSAPDDSDATAATIATIGPGHLPDDLSRASGAAITTVAGTPPYSGDGGSATRAAINNAGGVAVDSSGNLFIADTNNNVVREVNAATGLITTVAGDGAYGYSGDDGPATEAQLAAPTGIALDAWGNLFIADFGNHVIREVLASSGVIHTFAGNGQCDVFGSNDGDDGPATAAKLAYPSGVALDSVGDLFIVDPWTGTVREVNASTGIISRVAGVAGGGGGGGYSGDGGPATDAALYWPTGIAVDSSGDLFIADSDNNAVREVSGSTGTITTVAGGLSGPGIYARGVAVDGSGNLFIADGGNDVVEEITGVNGLAPQTTIVAGDGDWSYSGDGGPATAAALNGPCGLAVDAAGNLFIADSGNNAVREVSDGVISTCAGSGWPTATVGTAALLALPGSTIPTPSPWTLQATSSSPTRTTT